MAKNKHESTKLLTLTVEKIKYSTLQSLKFFRKNAIGSIVILLATAIFFLPLITRIDSYSSGGDAMFNAWTLSRNHNCLTGNNCPNYVDANIYFPNKDTMLYSETQLSAGLLTLPLYFINDNPLFAFNVWTIVSFFLSGWFMYLLAKYLSKGNEYFSIIAGLVFEFAPFKMASIYHLQNLSILCLPLAVLFILKYFEKRRLGYLIGLFLTLLYVFYASWYQMVFILMGIGALLGSFLLLRLIKFKAVLIVAAVIFVALLSTLPLAKEYVRFSKSNNAKFDLKEQTLYSSSLADYFIPYEGTALGKAYYATNPEGPRNAYNLDSYSYHGITLYLIAFALLAIVYRYRKKGIENLRNYKNVIALWIVAAVGFLVSLGPLLKIKAGFYYPNVVEGINLAIPAPYIIIDKFLPQLSFIRATGRASILLLFALCCFLAIFAMYASKNKSFIKHKTAFCVAIGLLIFVELMPMHQIPMKNSPHHYNLEVPEVYKLIKHDNNINNIIVLASDYDYPHTQLIARAEQVLWAGYHNKNIFNGYSGYTPPNYFEDYVDYVNFEKNDIEKMRTLNIRYILVDKELSRTNPQLPQKVDDELKNTIYQDVRYRLYKL